MKKLLPILVVVIVAILSTGCTNPLLDPSINVHNSVHKEYVRYVESDKGLTDYQKAIRTRNVENYGRLLDELGK